MSDHHHPADMKGAVLAYNEGVSAMEAGQEDAAVAAWRRALELDQCLVPAAINLATFYQQKGDLRAELEVWEHIVAYDPFDTDHLVLQAAAFRRAGRLDKAVGNYHRAIAIYPYFKFWYHELAAIYEELGEHDEALLWRGRGDSLGADEAEICYEDGIRHVGDSRFESARTCFEAILDEFPANLDARLRLARVLERAGTPDEVVQQYQLAMELTEAAKGLVHYRLGEFYLKQGAWEDGSRELEAARRSVPRFYKAERALWQLEQQAARRQAEAASAEAASVQPAAAAPAQPAFAQPAVDAGIALLRPEEIGMEPVFEPTPVPPAPLQLRLPNLRLPWQQQLRQVLDQALAIASPSGHEPRVALVVEPDAELSEPTLQTLRELRGLGRSLRADADVSHIYVVQAAGTAASKPVDHGWLGRDANGLLKTAEWTRAQPGLPLTTALELVRTEAAGHGFNCLIVISFGRCRGLDAAVGALLRATPLHCLCLLHPAYHYLDLRAAVSNSAPNLVEITC